MGGGFRPLITRTNSLETYAEEIIRFLKEDFGDELPEIILEPGPLADCQRAGILVSEVVLVAAQVAYWPSSAGCITEWACFLRPDRNHGPKPSNSPLDREEGRDGRKWSSPARPVTAADIHVRELQVRPALNLASATVCLALPRRCLHHQLQRVELMAFRRLKAYLPFLSLIAST